MTDFEAAKCWPCICDLHDECYDPQMNMPEEPEDRLNDDNWVSCCCSINPEAQSNAFALGVGRPVADPHDITDITSTGRKRAAMMYPVLDGMECEWAFLRYAGGGPEPIIGCSGNLLYAERGKYGRHHGPDKNVIMNDPGNVHRICMTCHNRWHALNNKYYGPRPPADQQYLPLPEHESKRHDPDTRATDEEIEENEAWWASSKLDRVAVDIND